MARRKLNGLRALVTGASSGIGRALAIELARKQVRSLLVARRGDRLDEVREATRSAGTQASVMVGDITDSETRHAAVSMCRSEFGGLDLLINNAGITASGDFAGGSEEVARQVFEVNFFAATELTRSAIHVLVDGQTPMVVNIGSILGHRGIPFVSAYCASKFAITGWTQSLRAELSTQGIDVLLVSPGTTDSELTNSPVEQRIQLPWAGSPSVTAERVARATVAAIERGKHEIVPNWRGWWMLFANRLAPTVVDSILAKFARDAKKPQ